MLLFQGVVFYLWILLDMIVAKLEPTSCYRDAYSVGTPKRAFWRKGWKNHCKTTVSALVVNKRTLFFFWEMVIWMLHIRRAGHPGPGKGFFTPGQLSVELVIVGGCLTDGDLALDSYAQFLAVAEHWLIPSWARSVGHSLRRAGHHSVWAPACQDKVAGGHAGVGVVSLGAAPLALPTCATAGFLEFFKLGRALRVTLPAGSGEVVHLFVVYGYQWAEEDAEKLQFTDKLLQAVLAEAGVVCAGQPVLIAGDLNADPAVIPCLAKAICAGRFVDLALACSLGKRTRPAATCKFKLDECSGFRRGFILGCSTVVAASTACRVTDRWFPPYFSFFYTFGIDGWSDEVSCPVVSQPLWPA